MTESTRKIIEAAISGDTSISSDERRRIMQSLAPAVEMPVKLVTTRTVCEMLEISRRTLFSWVARGKLKAIRRSCRSIRYDLAAVKKLMVEGMTETEEK